MAGHLSVPPVKRVLELSDDYDNYSGKDGHMPRRNEQLSGISNDDALLAGIDEDTARTRGNGQQLEHGFWPDSVPLELVLGLSRESGQSGPQNEPQGSSRSHKRGLSEQNAPQHPNKAQKQDVESTPAYIDDIRRLLETSRPYTYSNPLISPIDTIELVLRVPATSQWQMHLHPEITLQVLDDNFLTLVRVDFIAEKCLPVQALQIMLLSDQDGWFSVSPKLNTVRILTWHILNYERLGKMRSEGELLFCRALFEGYEFPHQFRHRDAFVRWWKNHPGEYLPRFAGEKKWRQFKNIGKTLETLIEEAAKKGQDMEVSNARRFFKMLMGLSPGGPNNPVPQVIFSGTKRAVCPPVTEHYPDELACLVSSEEFDKTTGPLALKEHVTLKSFIDMQDMFDNLTLKSGMMFTPELPFQAQEIEKIFRAAPKQQWIPEEPNPRAKVLFHKQDQYVEEAEIFEVTIQQLQRILDQLKGCQSEFLAQESCERPKLWETVEHNIKELSKQLRNAVGAKSWSLVRRTQIGAELLEAMGAISSYIEENASLFQLGRRSLSKYNDDTMEVGKSYEDIIHAQFQEVSESTCCVEDHEDFEETDFDKEWLKLGKVVLTFIKDLENWVGTK
ncbi:hypothetical protein FKW77_003279 [Venturia effusa]|uniref:Uncharacterized protein n=1 Tax=Venturia effusa TaxID=50376 RepID=A0A517LF55_9PEZI|nr:hypothetical protein FKW77_003279 [Venturia effusa]